LLVRLFWLRNTWRVGVLATLTAEIMMGQYSDIGRFIGRAEAVVSFWDYAAFVVNSLSFLLLGILEAPRINRVLCDGHRHCSG